MELEIGRKSGFEIIILEFKYCNFKPPKSGLRNYQITAVFVLKVRSIELNAVILCWPFSNT